jgi:hypothetical protein
VGELMERLQGADASISKDDAREAASVTRRARIVLATWPTRGREGRSLQVAFPPRH